MATTAIRSKRQSHRLQPPPVPMMQFTVEQYERMFAEGILAESERLELLDGWIVVKMTHNPPHDSAVTRLHRRLDRLVGDDWVVRVQCTIAIPGSLPEPDVAVVSGPEERYDRARPRPRDIALLVEVSDSSLAYDQGVKLQAYARSHIRVYWIVNLIDGRIEVYQRPRGGKAPTYLHRQDYGPGERVPVVLGGEEVGALAVDDLLP